MKNTIAYFFDEAKSLLFLGRKSFIRTETTTDLIILQSYLEEHPNTYKAIALSYDLKNEIAGLTSCNSDKISFPNVLCWEPEYVFQQHDTNWEILFAEDTSKAELALHLFLESKDAATENLPKIEFIPTENHLSYLEAIKEVQKEIQYGNTYEVNYCQEFTARDTPYFNSMSLVKRLFQLTKAPFSTYLQLDELEVFCGSPERFLQRKGNKLISQPIKGTVARSKNQEEDVALKASLKASKKDFSENVMIVDLVRNDLSRIAQKGTVNVEELAEVHSFETVHHLISTISCEIKPLYSFTDIIKATFPMGSMTGAPKKSTMLISERLEKFKRGIYSGSIGYIRPNGDFDLNVVIRSLIKNNAQKTMTCSVGGAITIQSNPEKEYEECLVKVGKILRLFD